MTTPFTITLFKPNPEHSPARFAGHLKYLPGLRELFLTKPPYGRMTAIDLTTGEHRWMVPVGDGPHHHPALKALQLPPLGWPARTHTLLTKTLLFGGQEGKITCIRDSKRGFAIKFDIETRDPKLLAFDKASGTIVAEIALPANIHGAPMPSMAGGQ
jgi:quinoprotein glucose dehydrogenase